MKKVILVLIIFLFCQALACAAVLKHPEFYRAESHWISYSGEKFRLCRITSNGASKIVQRKTIKVYFRENVSILGVTDKRKLKRFFDRLPKNTFSIKITSHADTCGNHNYNLELARKRGWNVYQFIKEFVPERVEVIGKNNGENHSRGHIAHDRYVEVVVEYWNPRESISKIVLFDISGSLHNQNIGHTTTGLTLNDLKRVKLPKGVLAYVPRDFRYKCQGQDLNNYHPRGEDFYWEAMTLLSQSLKGKINGVVYTDDTDIEGQKKEALFNSINKDNIRWYIK